MTPPASGTRRRIVVATGDDLTPTLAGPGIRAWNMADVLSGDHDVVLATTGACDLTHPRASVRSVSAASDARAVERWCDVLISQGLLFDRHPFLLETDKPVVVDLYDPFHLEQLERSRARLEVRDQVVGEVSAVVNEQLLRGDFFLCASERQRDFWLGHLAALGRVNARTYDADPSLDALLSVVPFGLPVDAPAPGPPVKGTVAGLGIDDTLILWAGGVYDWLDPLTVVRATARVVERHPEVRLLFLGMGHPREGESSMAGVLRRLVGDLGLTQVLFNDGWVPYEERHRWLADADIGVSAHLRHVEAAFAFRTRILDYIWSGLPVVTTSGDTLSELVDRHGLGLTVPPGDDEAMARALLRLLDDPVLAAACTDHEHAVAPTLTWPRVLEPLVRFCASPGRAPDLEDPDLGPGLVAWRRRQSRARRGWRRDAAVAVRRLRRRLPPGR